jgi:hypothetical protein
MEMDAIFPRMPSAKTAAIDAHESDEGCNPFFEYGALSAI